MINMFDEALVTIGMPVRNGGEQVKIALESLLAQTHRNIRVIISDNCSTDNTFEVCQAYASKDNRVEVVRQPENLGICGNFRYVLMRTEGPFFMWACHDDVWAPDFIAKNLAALAAHPTAVASTSKVAMALEGVGIELSNGTYPLMGSQRERLKRFLWNPGEASRFYAVFHTEPLKRSFPADIDVFGFDWIVLALNLLEGEHLELPEVLLTREAHPDDHYFEGIVKRQPDWLHRWMPHLPMAGVLRAKLPPAIWKACRMNVVRRNLIQLLMYAKFRIPVVRPAVRALSQVERARTSMIERNEQVV